MSVLASAIYPTTKAPHRRHPMSVYQLSFSAYCIPVVVMFNLPTYILSLAQNMYKHGLASWLVRLLSNARLPYAYSSNTCTSYVQRNINQLWQNQQPKLKCCADGIMHGRMAIADCVAHEWKMDEQWTTWHGTKIDTIIPLASNDYVALSLYIHMIDFNLPMIMDIHGLREVKDPERYQMNR